MADTLKTKMSHHLGDKALTALFNLQKIFAHATANKKSAKDPAQHTPNTKMTHLPAPSLNPAPEKLSVASSISPLPLRDTAPPPRVAFRPPPRVATPPDIFPPTSSPNVPTSQTAAPLIPKAAPPCCSPRIAALNIQRQVIRESETAAPHDLESNEKSTPDKNTRSKTAIRQSTQEEMLDSFDIGQHTDNSRTLARREYSKGVLVAVLNKDTGELMEYRHLVNKPKYCALWIKSCKNKLGHLAQGIPGWVKVTDTIFFNRQVRYTCRSMERRHVRPNCL